VSYAHNDDKRWIDELLTQLSWLQRQHNVQFWSDREIDPGSKWHDAIQQALDRAKVAILLVSPDFLASSYIASNELPKMLHAAENDGMTIFWIPIRHSAYQRSAIVGFQSALNPSKPLISMSTSARDQAWVEIGEKLARSLEIPN
jgi:hypothetical protein